MNKANISYARNHLSKILSMVREGETVLIMDRDKPVARLEPVEGLSRRLLPWQTDLVKRGLVSPAKGRLDLKSLQALPLPEAVGGGDVLDALLADREEGR